MSYSVFFASSNQNKYEESRKILKEYDIKLKFLKCNLEEIQSNSLGAIVRQKALQAYSMCKLPVIVEDAGLFIDSLKGFPGPYSSFVFETIGNNGVLKLLSNKRSASFKSIIAYCEKKEEVNVFEANVHGKISRKVNGSKWGFDPIFIPSGWNKTFSLLAEKNKISHRYFSLKKFANWYLRRMQSTDL